MAGLLFLINAAAQATHLFSTPSGRIHGFFFTANDQLIVAVQGPIPPEDRTTTVTLDFFDGFGLPLPLSLTFPRPDNAGRGSEANLLVMPAAKAGQVWVANEETGQVGMYDLHANTEIRRFNVLEQLHHGPGEQHNWHKFIKSADGATLFLKGNRKVSETHQSSVWIVDAGTGQVKELLTAEHLGGGAVLAFSPDGRLVITRNNQSKPPGPTRIQILESGEVLTNLTHSFEGITSAAFSHDGRVAILSGYTATKGGVTSFDVQSGQLLKAVDLSGWPIGFGGYIAVSKDNRFVIGAANLPDSSGGAVLVNIDAGIRLRHFAGRSVYSGRWVSGGIIAVAIAPNNEAVLTLDWNRQLKEWDIRELVTAPGFRPAVTMDNGRNHLELLGEVGQRIRVQRSTNLREWEDWQTVTLDSTTLKLTDDPASAAQRFYRAVEDDSNP